MINFEIRKRNWYERKRPMIQPWWEIPLDNVDNSAMMSFFRYIEQSVDNNILMISIDISHDWETKPLSDNIGQITSYIDTLARMKHGCGVRLINYNDRKALWVLERKLPKPKVPVINSVTASLTGSGVRGIWGSVLRTGEKTTSAMRTANKMTPGYMIQKGATNLPNHTTIGKPFSSTSTYNTINKNMMKRNSTAIRPAVNKMPSTTKFMEQNRKYLNRFSRTSRGNKVKQSRITNAMGRNNGTDFTANRNAAWGFASPK